MASLAEQLRSLSNPEPSRFDLDEDEFDLTRAQVVNKETNLGDIENQAVSNTSVLRKKTLPILEDEDQKYAGRKISRAQLEASRDHVEGSDGEEESEVESDSEGEMQNDDDDDTDDGDDDDADIQEKVVRKRDKLGTTDDFDNGNDVDDNESSSIHSTEDHKNGRHFSASEDDFNSDDDDNYVEDENDDDENENDDDDDDDVDDNQDDEEEEESEDNVVDAIQSFSAASLTEDIEKGAAAKNQLSLWDSFLEMRIRLQKALLVANKLPQNDQMAEFSSSGDKNLKEMYKQGRKTVAKLLGNLLLIQEKLLEQNPDTANILHPGADSNKSTAHGSDDDEEIPSDTEDEKSDEDNADDKDGTSGEKDEDSLKLPAKRRHELATQEYAEYIAKRHTAFKSYRDATISKWSEKTRLASGKLNSKSFSLFDRSALAQINHILSDKERLIKRTQLKRTSYRVLGKPEEDEKQKSATKEEQSDIHLRDYDPEIFDDDDFYHQLLREFIEQRTSGSTGNPIEMGRQWLELQKLRRKVKRKVDTRASKGRKIRYDIHGKLVSFMAPIEKGVMTDSSRNELFSSLFGAKQQEQAADISVFR